MKKFLLYLTLCFSPLCWGQNADVPGDWDKVVDEQPQPEMPLEEPRVTSELSPAVQTTEQKVDEPTKQPVVTYGVGLNGADEQQLNILDSSSLMDYEEGHVDFAGDEGGVLDDEFYSDEYILDSFEEDAELTFESFEGSEGFGEFDSFEASELPEDFDFFADESDPVEELIFID